MERWLVELTGESFDLDELPRWFPTGRVYSFQEGNQTFLGGAQFDELKTPDQVREAALQALDEFSSIVALLQPEFRKPEIGAVFHEDDDGRRKAHKYLSAQLTVRAKLRASLTVDGQEDGPTQAQELLGLTRRDRHLQVAVALWGQGSRTWPYLYRILEEIETSLGRTVDVGSLCSRVMRRRFTQSANSADIAADESRHATGKVPKPANPMDLGEARAFIRDLILKVCRDAQPE